MQPTRELNWRDREVLQLQEEAARLIRLLGALTPLGPGAHHRPGRREGPPLASRRTRPSLSTTRR
jgi:hypothetical protein